MRDADFHLPNVERSGDLTTVTITAPTAHAAAGALARELGALETGTGARLLLLDFTNVTFISGTELGALVGLHKRAEAAGGRLTLFNLSLDVFRLFALTRLDTLLDVCRPGAPVPAGA